MDNLEWLKMRTEEENEELLKSLLEDAEVFVLMETNRTYLPEKLSSLPRKIALIEYNRLGTEGEKSRSEGGESHTFEAISEPIRKMIVSARIARCGGHAFEKKQEETDILPSSDSGNR